MSANEARTDPIMSSLPSPARIMHNRLAVPSISGLPAATQN